MHLIESNIQYIITLCKKYKVRKLFVFGSILTERFNDDSDIDFCVEFDRQAIENECLDWANLFFDFLNDLQQLLKRKIDIVFNDYINNHYFREELERTKKLIYG